MERAKAKKLERQKEEVTTPPKNETSPQTPVNGTGDKTP